MADDKLLAVMNIIGKMLATMVPAILHFADEYQSLKGRAKAGTPLTPSDWAKNDKDFEDVVARLRKILEPDDDDEEPNSMELIDDSADNLTESSE